MPTPSEPKRSGANRKRANAAHLGTSTFDYVIVGAGSAGCLLANRLSADPDVSVLLIEGGGDCDHPFIKMPRGVIKIWANPRYFWYFPIAPQLGRPAERWNYGKGLGGSSSVNGTWYLRGMPDDFDGWEKMGLQGWNWTEIERCYAQIEDCRGFRTSPRRGKGGPLQITRSPFRARSLDATIAAAEQMGLPRQEDINTPGTEGVGFTQSTVDARGRRVSSYTAFVASVKRRPNLTVVTWTQAKRIIFDGKRAVAVECATENGDRRYEARREIILSAGVYKSPQILQLSGIGPGELLRRFGIPVMQDLPAVGRNVRDHAMLSMSFRLKGEKGMNHVFSGWQQYLHGARYFMGLKGLMAHTGMPLTILMSGASKKNWPDLQIGVGPFSMRSSKERKADPGRGMLEDKPGITFNGFHLRPASTGEVAITSTDYRDDPAVIGGWWTDPSDRDMAVLLIRKIRELAAMPALQPFCGEEVSPGAAYQSDEEIADQLRWLLSPGLHATGSCSMGTDPGTSVVDARCRVHGLSGLRVVDCSIMPTPVSGNTNGPAMVVAERASEMILEDALAGARAQQ